MSGMGTSVPQIACSSNEGGNGGSTARIRLPGKPDIPCQICGDLSSGYHLGTYACEACKKFFIRSTKPNKSGECVTYVCPKNKDCVINQETRTQCQFCRLQKCTRVGMARKGARTAESKTPSQTFSKIPCEVCGAESSGFHFGAITCEGCKGFFRRTIKERDSDCYVCPRNKDCQIISSTRNTCRYCRYSKCLSVGMCVEGSRIGRQPIHIKRQILKGNLHYVHMFKPCKNQVAEGQTVKSDAEAVKAEEEEEEDSSRSSSSCRHGQSVASQSGDAARVVAVDESNSEAVGYKCQPSKLGFGGTFASAPEPGTTDCQAVSTSRTSTGDSDGTSPTSMGLLQHPHRETHASSSSQSAEATAYHYSRDAVANTQTGRTAQQDFKERIATQTDSTSSHYFRHPNEVPPSRVATSVSSQLPYNQSHVSKTECLDFNTEVSPMYSTATENYEHLGDTYAMKEPSVGRGLSKSQTRVRSHLPSTSHARRQGRTSQNRYRAAHSSTTASSQPPHRMEYAEASEPHSPLVREGPVNIIMPTEDPCGVVPCDINTEGNPDAADDPDITEELLCHMQPEQPVKYEREFTWETRHLFVGQQVADPNEYIPETAVPLARDQAETQELTPAKELPFVSRNFISISQPPMTYDDETQTFKPQVAVADPQLASFIETVLSAAEELESIRYESPSIPRLTEGSITTNTLWEKMMKLFSKHVHCVLKFAKKLPGFRSFPISDQITMVQNAVFQIVVTILAKDYNRTKRTYNYFSMTEEERQKVILLFPQFSALSSQLQTYGEALSPLKLDNTENALLSALQLITTDWPGLEDVIPIEKLQDRICSSFENYCLSKSSDGHDRFGMILMMIPQLRRFASIHHECVLRLQREMPHLDFPQLWNEIVYSDH